MTRSLLTASLFLLLSLLSRGTKAGVYADPRSGFTVQIPDDWKQIPPAQVASVMQSLLDPATASRVHVLNAFEPATHTASFQYPYLIFAEISYPPGKNYQNISEADLKQIVSALNGVTTSQLKKSLAPNAANLLDSSMGPSASYFTSPPGFILNTSSQVLGRPINGCTFGMLGREHCIRASIYYSPEQAAAISPIIDRLAATFRLDPSQALTLQSATPANNPATVPALLAIGIILLLGLFYLFKRRTNKTPRPPRSP